MLSGVVGEDYCNLDLMTSVTETARETDHHFLEAAEVARRDRVQDSHAGTTGLTGDTAAVPDCILKSLSLEAPGRGAPRRLADCGRWWYDTSIMDVRGWPVPTE